MTSDLFPAKMSHRRPGGWPPRAGLHGHQLGQRQQQRADRLRLVLAASCWQCCTSRLNTARNAAVSGVRGEQRDQLMQQVRREHVVCEEWVQC